MSQDSGCRNPAFLSRVFLNKKHDIYNIKLYDLEILSAISLPLSKEIENISVATIISFWLIIWIHTWFAVIIIFIILYFENVAFFYAKLWSDVFPRVDNQTSGDTLQDLTRPLVEKSPSASYRPIGIGVSFWWQDALPHQPVRIREKTL